MLSNSASTICWPLEMLLIFSKLLICPLDVERNNVKVQEILVSFPSEKRMNGKQNYFHLSYLCHRKKRIHVMLNFFQFDFPCVSFGKAMRPFWSFVFCLIWFTYFVSLWKKARRGMHFGNAVRKTRQTLLISNLHCLCPKATRPVKDLTELMVNKLTDSTGRLPVLLYIDSA